MDAMDDSGYFARFGAPHSPATTTWCSCRHGLWHAAHPVQLSANSLVCGCVGPVGVTPLGLRAGAWLGLGGWGWDWGWG